VGQFGARFPNEPRGADRYYPGTFAAWGGLVQMLACNLDDLPSRRIQMNDTKAGTDGSNHKPKWWTDNVESSWSKVKIEAIADWKKVVATEKRAERAVDEQAIAFGHGAREAYQQMQTWTSDLEARLKADWQATTDDAEHAWDKVSGAIKHGWERAVAAVTPADAKSKAEPVEKA
jgi:hypothetical protein